MGDCWVEVPATCKAAVLVESGRPLEIREVAVPEVEPNAILIRVEMAGVCGTDVHLHQGAVGAPVILPVIPGHEGLGRIARLGQGRTHDALGEPLSPGDWLIKNKRHRYAFGKMVSNTYSLTQVDEALASMRAGKEIKAAIVP
jgi:D-arabinose 1-dehydrogenase-like Zn-dependent alcohol dehydrogenase